MKLALRPYQVEALERVAAARQRGVLRQLGVAATGLGKTVMFCALAEATGGRTLILAHRDELISQAAHKVTEVWPAADVGIVKAGENDVTAEVVVASVQTLARAARLRQLVSPFADETRIMGTAPPFSLVVVDEAHHAAADSYRRILEAVGCHGEPRWDRPLLLGVTATPDRGDGKGLDDLFDEISFSYDILWGIRAGYLADVRGKQIKLAKFDEANLKVSRGDYESGAAGRMLTDAGAPAAIAKAWQQEAPGRRTIVFTPTVDLASDVAHEFQVRGVKAAMVHGGTPLDERRDLLRRFSDGDITVMANCAVLTEGYDNPAVDCIIIARPTKSRALYTQMIGRGTRLYPEKDHLLVLDVVGAASQHSLVTIPSLFGLEQEFRDRAKNGSAPVSQLVHDQEQEFVRIGRLRADEVELFDRIRSDGIAWVKVHRDGERKRYVRSLGKDQHGNIMPTVVLAERPSGQFVVGLQFDDGRRRVLMDEVELELAQGVGEDFIRKNSARSALHNVNAPWRKGRPSTKAIELAKKWHIKIDPSWNAGQLSDAIDERIAKVKQSKELRERRAGSTKPQETVTT